MAGLFSASNLGADGGLDLARGAIAGAMIMAAAYLAGFAAFKRSATAVCAVLTVFAAATLEFFTFGLLPAASSKFIVLLEGVFAAALLVFVSAAIRPARNNALLGGLMFAGALTLIGIGLFNMIGRADLSGLMRIGAFGAGVFVLLSALAYSVRDLGARLLVPGLALALAAPAAAGFGWTGASSPAAHGVFVFGVLAATLVALLDNGAQRPVPVAAALSPSAPAQRPTFAAPTPDPVKLSENQLAQVLDYSGVAVWDWSPMGVRQTDGLAELMGADSTGLFTPDAMRAFIDTSDLAKFESHVLDSLGGDAAFDVVLRLHHARSVRMRGARAVDDHGAIERLVAFIEPVGDASRSAAALANAPVVNGERSLSRPDALIAEIGPALKSGEITADFQPIVSLTTGKVAGYETLARWRGEVSESEHRATADELVRAAHSAGEHDALAALMLKEAASYLASKGKAGEGQFIAINVSARQAQSQNFIDLVKSVIESANLKPKALVLELTETEAIADIDAAGKAFRALAEAGAALALDDFGAGFSSLSHLKRFKFDYLKIDKSLIADLATEKGGDKGGGKIARALAGLAKDLGVAVIAEGVETRELADIAKAVGCTYGQGFAFGAPSKDGNQSLLDADHSAPEAKAEALAENASPAPVLAVDLAPKSAPTDAKPARLEIKPRRRLWGRELR